MRANTVKVLTLHTRLREANAQRPDVAEAAIEPTEPVQDYPATTPDI